MIIMYGIKNCDTIKKAKKWLDNHQLEYSFHDYRVDGLEKQWLINACHTLGWELVLNKRGTTFRQLDNDVKDKLTESSAIEQMILAPAMIKRPILSVDDQLHIGFKDTQYSEIFNR